VHYFRLFSLLWYTFDHFTAQFTFIFHLSSFSLIRNSPLLLLFAVFLTQNPEVVSADSLGVWAYFVTYNPSENAIRDEPFPA
jgi:hypothetical protein